MRGVESHREELQKEVLNTLSTRISDFPIPLFRFGKHTRTFLQTAYTSTVSTYMDGTTHDSRLFTMEVWVWGLIFGFIAISYMISWIASGKEKGRRKRSERRKVYKGFCSWICMPIHVARSAVHAFRLLFIPRLLQ